MKDAYRLHEARSFEKIWQNTVSQQIQSGVVFYNSIQGVISVNQKFREIVGIPNNFSQPTEKEKISKEEQLKHNNTQKSSFDGYQFPRQENTANQVNMESNQQQIQDQLNASFSHKIQENLFNLSQYFNQHLHWDTNKSNSFKLINVQNSNKNRKFKVNKYNFYGLNKNFKQDLNDDFNEDIDWSQILVKPKQVKLLNEKHQEDQPSQQNDQQNNQSPENQNQKTLAGNITVNSINRDPQILKEQPSSSNLQTPNFGNKMIQKTQLIKNNLMNFDEQQSMVKVKIRIPILEIFYELSQKCLEQYKINQMILQEQKNKKEKDNFYNQVQNDRMKSQVSCVSECYKVIKTKNIIRIITQAYLIRGRAYYIFSIEGDIKAKQELQNQMETRKQDLLQLASILHDLKTPLNCISGTSQILRAFVESDQPALMPYLRNFDLSLEFIFAMIEDIQDLAKFSGSQNFSLTNEFFEVRGFLKDVLVLFEQQCAFKNIDLKRFVDDNVPTKIYSDQKRIKQILMNMISNALKFTTKGYIMVSFTLLDDEIEISNEHQNNVSEAQQELNQEQNISNSINENAKKSEIQSVSKDRQNEAILNTSIHDQSIAGENQASLKQKIKKRMMIVIEDTGLGIKKDDLQKLFKYFGKLKDKKKINQKGTGLGLNITRRIVEAMGGTIEVQSEYKQGTKFTMIVNIQVKQGDQFLNKKILTESSDQNINQGTHKFNQQSLKQSDQNLSKKNVLKLPNSYKLSTIVEENFINTPRNQDENNQDIKEKNERLQQQNHENYNKKRRQSRPQNDQRNFNFVRNDLNKSEIMKIEEMGSQKISSYNISIQSEITLRDQKQSENQQSQSNFHNSKDKDDSQFKKKQNKNKSSFAAGYKMGKIQPKYSDRNVSTKLQEIQQYFTKPINQLNTSKNLFSENFTLSDENQNEGKTFITERNIIKNMNKQQEEEKIEIKQIERFLKGESVQSNLKRELVSKKGKKKKLNMIRSNDSKAIDFPLLIQNNENTEKTKSRAKSIANNIFKFKNRLSKEQSKISTEDSKFKDQIKVNLHSQKELHAEKQAINQSNKINPISKQSSKKLTISDENSLKRNEQITKNADS